MFFAATAESSDELTQSVAQWVFLSPFGLGILANPSSTGVEDLVEKAARHVDAVVLGAYDGEGLLVWARHALFHDVVALGNG